MIAWSLALVLAISLGAAIALSPMLAGLFIVCAGVVVLLVLPAPVTLVAVVIAFLLPLTQLDVGGDTRLLTPILLGRLVVKGRASRHATLGQSMALRLVPLCALAVASLAWSQDPSATGGAALALLAVVVCLFLVPAAIDGDAVLQTMRWLMTTLIVASAVAALTPLGQLGGRFRGIFGNPNALAIVLLLAAPLFMRGRWRLMLPVVVVLAFATASRAGVGAVAVGVLFFLFSSRSSRQSTRVLAVLLAGGILILILLNLDSGRTTGATVTQLSDVAVLRNTNSRQVEWTQAIQIWRDAPLIGHGFGASNFETGNSYLKLLVDLGLFGLLTAIPFLFLLLRLLMTSKNPLVVAATAAALVSSIFEAWLLTAGSAFFIIFCLIVQTAEMKASDGPHDP